MYHYGKVLGSIYFIRENDLTILLEKVNYNLNVVNC